MEDGHPGKCFGDGGEGEWDDVGGIRDGSFGWGLHEFVGLSGVWWWGVVKGWRNCGEVLVNGVNNCNAG